MSLQNYVRHKLTPYDAMLEQGYTRAEARGRIEAEIKAIITDLPGTPPPILSAPVVAEAARGVSCKRYAGR